MLNINGGTNIHSAGDSIAEIKVENIVATTVIAEQLDLKKVGAYLKGGEFSPERFPGLIYHTRQPKSAVLLFRSGKLVCTGTRSITDVKSVINGLSKKLRKSNSGASGAVVNPEIQIQNIVASADLETKIELVRVAVTFGIERIEYEPEQFPGLVYRIKEPKVVMLIFSSGKIVCTGGRTVNDIKLAVDKLKQELSAAGFLR